MGGKGKEVDKEVLFLVRTRDLMLDTSVTEDRGDNGETAVKPIVGPPRHRPAVSVKDPRKNGFLGNLVSMMRARNMLLEIKCQRKKIK